MTQQLYRYFGQAGELLYIGVSHSAVARAAQHQKDKCWAPDITHIEIENYSSRKAVLDAERAAIKSECPKYNKVHNRGKAEPLLDGFDSSALERYASRLWTRGAPAPRQFKDLAGFSDRDGCPIFYSRPSYSFELREFHCFVCDKKHRHPEAEILYLQKPGMPLGAGNWGKQRHPYYVAVDADHAIELLMDPDKDSLGSLWQTANEQHAQQQEEKIP